MRYLIQCVDGSTRRISEEERKLALVAWMSGKRFLIRGTGYAPHHVSAIKTMKDWWEQQKSEGKKICKYGSNYEWGDVCECKRLGMELLPADERSVLSLPEPMRAKLALPEGPQTREERRRVEAYESARTEFLRTHTMKPAPALLPVPSCGRCNGSGVWLLEGCQVTCDCITDKMHETPNTWTKAEKYRRSNRDATSRFFS